MKVKVLVEDRFRILAVMEGEGCPVEQFLEGSDSACSGLVTILQAVASSGFEGVPSKWTHEASKSEKIFQFIKGDFRLLFFKGQGNDIAVCVHAVMKKGKKADSKSVAHSAKLKTLYAAAIADNTLEIVDEN